jgi:hypothetical protein
VCLVVMPRSLQDLLIQSELLGIWRAREKQAEKLEILPLRLQPGLFYDQSLG